MAHIGVFDVAPLCAITRGISLLLLLFASACHHRPLTPAFYHWQTQLALTPAETAYLDTLGCRKLYVKVLDIARDPLSGDIRPYALLDVADTLGLAGKQVVPCIFITNSVFENCSSETLDWLAGKTAGALAGIQRPFFPQAFGEIQFDCDWTPGTRDAFFSFIKKIRPRLGPGLALSATIRLHQYKFPSQTGVPPTDRGMLMLYNTGDIDDWAEDNSIFQPLAARKYLLGAPPRYPLPLDLALPLFSWALVYRDDALWKIIPGPGAHAFADSSRFETLPAGASAGRFRIRKATLLAGHYLRPGDLIRVERVDSAGLQAATQLAAGIPLSPDASVAFYHLDTSTLQQYPAPWLKTVWATINTSR